MFSVSPGGVNLQTSLTNIRVLMQESLRNESLRNYVGGNATVLLYLINGNVQNNEQVWEQARLLNDTIPGNNPHLLLNRKPIISIIFKISSSNEKLDSQCFSSDLRIIFASASNQFDNLWNLVRDMHNDIKMISLSTTGTNVEIIMGSTLDRIRQCKFLVLA